MIRRIISLVLVFMFSLAMVMPPQGFTQVLPENGVFINGIGQIEINGNIMDVNSLSNKSIIEWLSFCIQQGYTVNFNQPSSAAAVLNRVTGANPSEILGNLMSNGQVFLINPNGILFGASSSVNAPGLVASTLNISNDDFLNGNYQFLGQGGSVVNQGSLSSPGGYVALLGSSVDNSGVIVSSLGTVAMASGEKITLGLDASGLISVAVDEAVTQNLGGADAAIKNIGTINADGGTVILTSKALGGVFNKAINNEGIIEANELGIIDGKIILRAEGNNNADIVSSGNIVSTDIDIFSLGNVSVRHIEGDFVELSGRSIKGIDKVIPGPNIISNILKLYATHGIGLNNGGLLTDVNDLYALNTIGGIRIYDLSGDLNVVNVSNQASGYDVEISSDGHMNLGQVLAFEGGAILTSRNGGIVDSNGVINNIIADHTILSAKNGIGSGTNQWIETNVNSLQATNTGSGHIQIHNNGDLTLQDIAGVGHSIFNNDGHVLLKADSLHLAGLISANGSSGSVHMNALIGDITTQNLGKIVADYLLMSAENGSVGLGTNLGILTQVNSLKVNAHSGIRVTDTAGDLNVINALNFGLGHDIEITSEGSMNLGYAWLSGGSVYLTSNSGAISDNNGDGINIVSDNAILAAKHGIGSGNTLETMVSSLQATNTHSGNIDINNQGNLTLSDISGSGYAVKNFNGDVFIKTDSHLNIADGVHSSSYAWLWADQDINLSSGVAVDSSLWSFLWSKNDINMGLGSSISGLTVSLQADNDINMGADASISSANISNITAGRDMNMNVGASVTASHSANLQIGRDVNMLTDSEISSGNFATINAGRNVLLGLVQGQDARINANAGAIADNNANAVNIIADKAILKSSSGIGSSTDTIEVRTASPWINALSLTANNSTSGGIYIDGLSGNMDVVSVVNNGGDVRLSSVGLMGVSEIFSSNNVQLTAKTINSLDSAGANVTANNLTLSAMNGIGLNTGLGFLTDVNNLYAYNNGTGGIRIVDIAGDLNVVNALASGSGGNVSITSAGNMTLGHVLAFGIGNTATLISSNGNILDGNGSLANITADNIRLSAATGIGSVGDFLDLRSASAFMGNDTLHVQAANSDSGGIYLDGLSTSSVVPLNFYADSIINNGGDVKVLSANNLWIGYIEGQNVFLTASSGFISDDYNDDILDIKATTLGMSGKYGIGDYTALGLTTDVVNLVATNQNAGGIRLTDIGNLNIVSADAGSGPGNVEITSEGNMTLLLGIWALNGSVTLTSNNGAIVDGNGGGDDITAKALNLSAAHGIGSGDILEVYTNDLTAYNSNSGSIRIKDVDGDLYVESVVNGSLNGSVELIAFGRENPCNSYPSDMYVKSVISKNDVRLESTNGAIIDNNGLDLNIDSLSAELIADTGIGSIDALETKTDSLNFQNFSSGDVNIVNTVTTPGGNLQLGNLYASNIGTGDISISELIGDINAGSGLQGVFAAGGNIDLSTSKGDIYLNLVNSYQGNVSIDAFGSILGAQGIGANIVSGKDTFLNAGNVIGDWNNAEPLTLDVGGDLYLEIANNIGQATGSVGLIGVSGTLAGTVGGSYFISPGTKANAVNPFIGNPSGYIFLNLAEIWPLYVPPIPNFSQQIASLEDNLKAYWEILDPYRFVSIDPGSRTFYLYHPLRETDAEAFDEIDLDPDAYEFIEDNIELRRDISPFFSLKNSGERIDQSFVMLSLK